MEYPTTNTSAAAAACPEPWVRYEEDNTGTLVPYEVTPLAPGVRITRTSQTDVNDAWDEIWTMTNEEYAAAGLTPEPVPSPKISRPHSRGLAGRSHE